MKRGVNVVVGKVRILSDRIENLHETDFITIEGHDCHPDAIECCGDCLELNGYDVIEACLEDTCGGIACPECGICDCEYGDVCYCEGENLG